jgi:hypothetical protein
MITYPYQKCHSALGKRHRGLQLRLVVDSGRGWLTAYLNGRVLKRWPYKLWHD